MSEVRWEGHTHQEIYDAVKQGPGAGASTAAVDAWTRTEALITRIDQRITAAINGSQAGWEGSAADATRSAMTPLGQWALDAANDAKITASAVETQGVQAEKLRVDMPPPLTEQRNAAMEGALTDPTFIFHGLDDLQRIDQQAANDAAIAVDLMNRYTSDSYVNRRNMDFWTLPPQVTVVIDPAGTGPGGPGVTGIPGVPAPTPPAEVLPPAPGGAPPPGAATPPGVTPPVTPGGPGAAPGTPPVTPPAVVPPVPGQPPGANVPGPGRAVVPPAQTPPAVPPAPTLPTVPGGNPPPGGTAPLPGTVVPPGLPGAIPPGRPGATTPGGVRPVVPGPPPRATPPSWRDVVPGGPGARAPGARVPAPGVIDADQALPPGARAAEPPGARSIAEQAARTAATGPLTGTRPGVPGAAGAMYPPMAAGMGAGSDRERRRPDYLLDDTDAFADDRWFTPAVITPDDGPPVRR